MKFTKFAPIAAALALVATLAACSSTTSTYAQYSLDEVSGVKIEAENADTESGATSEGGLVIEEGDVLVISPFLDKGTIHVTVSTPDGATVLYDDDASGKVLFSVDATPGTYDVTTEVTSTATGEMTIFAQNADELAAQDAALDEALAEAEADEAK